MDRRLRLISSFESIKTDPWFHRVYSRLKKDESTFITQFIEENHSLDRNDFELRINRSFLDKPEKPKHWKEIQELLSNINSKSS